MIEQFDVTREQITAVLDFVAPSLRTEAIPAGSAWTHHSHRTIQGCDTLNDAWMLPKMKVIAAHDRSADSVPAEPAGRRIAVVVLTAVRSRVRQHVERIAAAVDSATPGSYVEVEIPFDAS